MHDIFNSRFLEKSLDSGNFLRDGCCGSSSIFLKKIKKRKGEKLVIFFSLFSSSFFIEPKGKKDGVGCYSQWNKTKVFFSQYVTIQKSANPISIM